MLERNLLIDYVLYKVLVLSYFIHRVCANLCQHEIVMLKDRRVDRLYVVITLTLKGNLHAISFGYFE